MIARGLGAGSPSTTAYTAVGVTAGTFGSVAAIPSILSAGTLGGPVGLAVAGIVAGVAEILSIAGVGSGCGQACIQATNIVNQAEPILQQNVQAYQSGGIDQATAINNFNQIWTSIQQACGAIPGGAGKNCVSDRQQGACKWKDSNGNCWNWFIGYYDPLLVPVSTVADSSVGSVTSSVESLLGGGSNGLLLAGGLAVVGMIMVMGS